VVRGFGLTPLPRPQQFYFGFGAPISTDRWAGPVTDAALRALRDEVRSGVEQRVATLQVERAAR